MAGISSQAFGRLEAKHKYNGIEFNHKEFSDGTGLDIYTGKFRGIDPQIGRWWQIDPKPAYNISLYSAMQDNPIIYGDLLGDTVIIKNGIARGDNVIVHLEPVVDRGKLPKGVQGIVLHGTAGGSATGAINTWKQEKGRAGAHVVVDKDGKIVQVVNLNDEANHVGETRDQSYPNNSNSVGVEVVGRYNEKTKTWEPLTQSQIKATADVVNAIMRTYNLTTKNIYEHDVISWKTAGEGTVVRESIENKLDVPLEATYNIKTESYFNY